MAEIQKFKVTYHGRNWYKVFFIALLITIFAMSGCEIIEEFGAEPEEPIPEESIPVPDDLMVSYLEDIKKKGILDDLEQMEVDIRSLENEIESLFQEKIEEQSIDGIEALREQVSTLIDQQTDLKVKVSILETGSKKVENANNHLFEAIKNQKNAINMFNSMFDSTIELIKIMEDPGCPDAKDELDRIIAEVEKDEIKINEYISASHDAIEAWKSIMEKGSEVELEQEPETLVSYDPSERFAENDNYWYVDDIRIEFGIDKQEIIALIGEPQKTIISDDNDVFSPMQELIYPELDILFFFYNDNYFPCSMYTSSPLITGPRNIKVGDTVDSVLNKFPDEGNPISVTDDMHHAEENEIYRRLLYGDDDYGILEPSGFIYYDNNKNPIRLRLTCYPYGYMVLFFEDEIVTNIKLILQIT